MRHGKKIMDREAEWQDLKKRLAEKVKAAFDREGIEIPFPFQAPGCGTADHRRKGNGCRGTSVPQLHPETPGARRTLQ